MVIWRFGFFGLESWIGFLWLAFSVDGFGACVKGHSIFFGNVCINEDLNVEQP